MTAPDTLPVIPFVSEAEGGERRAWQSALPEALSRIGIVKPFEELTAAEKDTARVAIVANPDPTKVAELKNLEWVQSLWAGVERLAADLPVDGPQIVRLMDPQMADTMSEAVLAWTLYLHRDMPIYAAQQKRKHWQQRELKLPSEQTIGVLGLGKLGQAAAQRLADNGFNVIGWSRSPKSIDNLDCQSGPDGFDIVLKMADILVLLMPLTSETRGLIGSKELQKCRKSVKLINFARGPILQDAALLEALESGQVEHAVLDVFDEEPLPEDHPYWDQENVTVLPHISAPTITSTACTIVASNLKIYFETGTIPKSVDRMKGY
ncbi:glyoxylate/hydroxypyruvate reductase A [Roseibium sp. TrichSKD4]|uniref:2-hydroxyacid dehydrogenase n=1 Tax=Roseibium sp. TrichSKD4 TaxID=744980 RepID=UPI0001E56EBB|nr:glyoxylate/hydroxypyruvate reductase A [Roseibium sp. TrichSKD4]EFO31620.1 glyoxylate/hydroxypyruvate reductase A [Roseibium sp. TrichSKD4]